MCGFSGIFVSKQHTLRSIEELATNMALAIKHRGPDDAGVWADSTIGLALGHRRLSIIDLSAAGHQPMQSASARFVLAFNGEIYNHQELRAELISLGLAPAWQGHSDTETLLAGFEAWGIENTLQRCVGMFAIALWDKQQRCLTLVRDRLGEKPLYYGWAGQGENRAFVFGSELKALRAYPGFANPICRSALAQYMRFNYVPAPLSIYEGVFKLEPGCLLTITEQAPISAPSQALQAGQRHETLTVSRWWQLNDAVQQGEREPLLNEKDALSALENALQEAIRLQSLADVPVGAFLSGGIDSSLIAALMQGQSSRPIKTFTVGFEEAGFDESPHAKAVAKHLGTEHHEVFVTAREALAVVPELPQMYDEPFADSSQIPTHLVCAAAKQQVTVALSGDAGDELFGGYNRYFWAPSIWSKVSWLPFPLRQLLGRGLTVLPPQAWDALASKAGVVRVGEKVHKLANCLQLARDQDGLYLSLVTEWATPESVVKLAPGSMVGVQLPNWPGKNNDQASKMMYWDSLTYLPDDILCKVDRAAMATSLETRVPFLDHRVAELAWRLPLHMKIRGGESKWALRQVLYKHVPRELIERPKAGFGIPVGQWLLGPLRDWAEQLLDASRLEREGYFHAAPIRRVWQEHLSGRFDHTPKLWSVLMFQSWLEATHP